MYFVPTRRADVSSEEGLSAPHPVAQAAITRQVTAMRTVASGTGRS
jgi:hypothetical protein